jgi:hypothetical protein
MSFVMGIAAKAMIGWLGSKNCRDIVNEFADNIDKAIDEKIGGHSEKLQEAFVREVIFPLSSRLMKENHQRLNTMYELEQHSLMGGIVYEQPKPKKNNFA